MTPLEGEYHLSSLTTMLTKSSPKKLVSSWSALFASSLALRWVCSCLSRLMRLYSAGQYCPISKGSSVGAWHSKAHPSLPLSTSSSLGGSPDFHASRSHARLPQGCQRCFDKAARASSPAFSINVSKAQEKGIALTAECSTSVVYLRLLYVRAHLSQLQASCTPVPLAPPHARCQTPACAFLQMMAS